MGEEPRSPTDPTSAKSRTLEVRPEVALELAPVHPEFLLGYLDLAITGALQYSQNQGVYLTPWWDLTPADRAGVRGWKRAVLHRNPHGGADHWGHLFLLCHEGLGRAELESETLAYVGAGSPRELIEIPLRVGHPVVVLILRPTYPSSREELARFARDIVDRFRLQMD